VIFSHGGATRYGSPPAAAYLAAREDEFFLRESLLSSRSASMIAVDLMS